MAFGMLGSDEMTMWKYDGQKRPEFADTPAPGQESVWDYPRPPRLVACSRSVEVSHGGQVIARATHTYRVLETASPPTFYVPGENIDWARLTRVPGQSFCEWKGAAHYYGLTGDADQAPVGWGYARPAPAFAVLRDAVAFYPGCVDCAVDGKRVRPQPGQFYGGWLTDDIAGPVKGAPGTQHW